jgi:hypothetical protein
MTREIPMLKRLWWCVPALAACGGHPAQPAPAEDRNAAVWEAALARFADSAGGSVGVMPVASARTDEGDSAVDRVALLYVRPYVSKALIDAWMRANTGRLRLRHPLAVPGKIAYVATPEDSTDARPERPVFIVSVPAFTEDGDTALVGIRRLCGPRCERYAFFHVERAGAIWIADRVGGPAPEPVAAARAPADTDTILTGVLNAVYWKFGHRAVQVSRATLGGQPALLVRVGDPALAALDSAAQYPEARRLATFVATTVGGRAPLRYILVGWAAQPGPELAPALLHRFDLTDLSR